VHGAETLGCDVGAEQEREPGRGRGDTQRGLGHFGFWWADWVGFGLWVFSFSFSFLFQHTQSNLNSNLNLNPTLTFKQIKQCTSMNAQTS